LGDGTVVAINSDGTSSEELDGKLKALRDANLKELRTELGRFARQVSGYGMHYLLPENGFNVAKALAGSEGTCGVITELVVRLVEKPKHTALAVLAFETVFDAAAAASSLRRPGLATAEGMGGDLLDALRSRPGQEKAGSNLPGMGTANRGGVAKAGGWLFCETAGQTIEQARSIADELVQSAYAAQSGAAIDAVVVTDHAEARTLWKIREASAGIVTRLPDGGEAWPSWEDSAVPPENLAGYLRDLYALMETHGLRGIPFGHFGEGCVHVRISFDLGTDEGVAIFRQFMERAADTVAKHGGSLSGEHGDGRARSELLNRMYSQKMMQAFGSFKAVFDPEGLFNPGVLVNPERIDDSLRPGPGQRSFELTPVHAL
ncbi:MAG: FAD-linked oxidase C-terminal domain-containing protein, partial [Glutamicibacter sp.]